MVEVLKIPKQYRIKCEKCHSLLKYDEYDELGKNEYKEKLENEIEKRKSYNTLELIAFPPLISGKLYVVCPVCKNKVITTKIWAHEKFSLGDILEE